MRTFKLAHRFACLGMAAGVLLLRVPATGPALSETVGIQRLDGSEVSLLLERPIEGTELPIALFIDGSGCVSAQREEFQDFARLPDNLIGSTARLIVEKPGVAPADDGVECSETFSRYYSIDQRVFDHLRAVQYLRKHAPWWNGELYVFGWSDGGSIGTSVAAYTPEVKRAVFGGMGGGIRMATQAEEQCAPDDVQSRDACVARLKALFDEIRSNPSPLRTWAGNHNTYKAWATRLDAMEYHLLEDLGIPFLIVHGAEDRDSVPVEGARELVQRLTEADVTFQYWEVPEMGHGFDTLPPGRRDTVRQAMLNWLFELELGPGGPPHFGRPVQ